MLWRHGSFSFWQVGKSGRDRRMRSRVSRSFEPKPAGLDRRWSNSYSSPHVTMYLPGRTPAKDERREIRLGALNRLGCWVR